jgi:hypothetical protein
VFPVKYELNLYLFFRRISAFYALVEAGSNTSTVDLRVVGGDGKGNQCLGL